jgi:hypothetical protein
MPASTTATIGFCEQVVQLLQDNKDDLQPKGLDVTNWIPEIDGMKDDAVTNDAQQDDMRAALKVKTKETQASVKLAYKTASTHLDAVIGVLGKDTPLAKQAARLRSSLNRKSKPSANNKPKP